MNLTWYICESKDFTVLGSRGVSGRNFEKQVSLTKKVEEWRQFFKFCCQQKAFCSVKYILVKWTKWPRNQSTSSIKWYYWSKFQFHTLEKGKYVKVKEESFLKIYSLFKKNLLSPLVLFYNISKVCSYRRYASFFYKHMNFRK